MNWKLYVYSRFCYIYLYCFCFLYTQNIFSSFLQYLYQYFHHHPQHHSYHHLHASKGCIKCYFLNIYTKYLYYVGYIDITQHPVAPIQTPNISLSVHQLHPHPLSPTPMQAYKLCHPHTYTHVGDTYTILFSNNWHLKVDYLGKHFKTSVSFCISWIYKEIIFCMKYFKEILWLHMKGMGCI